MAQRRLPEPSRLARLHRLGILDSAGDKYFATIAQRALTTLPGTSIAAVSLVDAERQWFKAIVGLDAKETPRSVSFCSHTIQSDGVMVVEDARQDSRFVDNPLVTGELGIRFYAGVRLMDGVGALCVIGMQPRRVSEEELAKLCQLAQFTDTQLMAHGALHQLLNPVPDEESRVRARVSSGRVETL